MRKIYPPLLIISSFFVAGGCSYDHGIAPLPGMVTGKVIYRGTRPANTQGVYLIVAPKFPPRAINELYHSPNSLETDKDTVHYEMPLPYGRYEAIGLWWYGTDTKPNLADILAIPLDPFKRFMPKSFEITPEEPVYHINLYANWDVVNRDAGIEGTLYFNGPYPPNTEATAVAAYVEKPVSSFDYIVMLRSLDFSVSGNPYHYRLPVHHGVYKYIVVFWLAQGAPLTDFKTLGFYRDPQNPDKPGQVKVGPNQTVRGIDIYVDWAKATP